jgi:hypothetical protein
MKNRLHLGHGAAIVACAASLAGTVTALAPDNASARMGTSCGSKIIAVPQKGGKSLNVPVSRIRVEGGATCAEAYAVIRGAVTKKLPSGWVVRPGNFQVPNGLTAQTARKGEKTVKYAVVGG